MNISINHLTDEVIVNCRNKGIKLGIWVSTKYFTESDSFYTDMLEKGVDYLIVDNPIRAREIKERLVN